MFGIKKFHPYLFGRQFSITSDHKPLQHLFKETSAIPVLASARIQRWALLLGGYDYKISYKPGDQHANADMLSRLPSSSTPPEPPASPENVHVLETLDSSPVTSAHIRQWTAKDPTTAKVRDSLIAGQRPRDDVAQSYRKCWEELSVLCCDSTERTPSRHRSPTRGTPRRNSDEGLGPIICLVARD